MLAKCFFLIVAELSSQVWLSFAELRFCTLLLVDGIQASKSKFQMFENFFFLLLRTKLYVVYYMSENL